MNKSNTIWSSYSYKLYHRIFDMQYDLLIKIYGDAWWTFRDSFNHSINHSIKTKLRRELEA